MRLFTEPLPDQVRALGAGHPHTLATRASIAHWTGRCGDAARALRLYKELLPDVERIHGPAHPYALATRGNIAHWAEEAKRDGG